MRERAEEEGTERGCKSFLKTAGLRNEKRAKEEGKKRKEGVEIRMALP